MKGFAITLDALIALSLFMMVMILIAGQTYQPRSPGSIYLKQLTLDTMTVLEKTGRVDAALFGNASQMQEVIEATPTLACIHLSITNSSDSIVVSAARNDCNDSTNLDMQVATKPILHQGRHYMLRAESWFRKEPD
jgi:hypothetical protein